MANKPNNPELWSRAKAEAKKRFDVYPSAYANGWAAKWYKSKGGTWRKAEYGMEVPMMQQGGGTDNPGFRALPEYVQAKILSNMGYGGITHPFMQDGGEPDGEMALGQIDASLDKLMKLRQFIQPESDLEPWVSSKLTMMDHYADAVSDYMMYNPEAQGEQEEMEQMMRAGGYVVTRSNDRKGKTHKVTGPDGSVKYFGDSKLGQHPNDPERKKAFYARHKKNLENNPHFRAFARKTWEEGGEIEMMKKGGSTFSGNAWYKQGGNINENNMYDYNPFLVMAQDGVIAPPRQEDYMDYESFVAAQDAYLQSLANVAGPYSDNVTVIPEMFETGPIPPAFPGQMPNVRPSSTSARKQGRTYSGPSIVDMLNHAGLPSDFNSRKRMAEEAGINSYTGTADQNMKLMRRIAKDPSVATSGAPASSNTKKSSSSSGSMLTGYKTPSLEDYINTTRNALTFKGAQTDVDSEQPSSNNLAWATAGILGGVGLAGINVIDLIGTDWDKLGSDKIFKGVDKRKLTLARKALLDEAFKAGAKNTKEAINLYSKLPAKAKKILANLEAMEIPGMNLARGSAMRNLQAWNAINESNAEDLIMRGRETATALQEAKDEAALLRRYNAQKAAAARWGKPAPKLPSAPSGVMNMLREGYAAARSTPLLKFLRKEYGGDIPYMQEGGEDPDTTFENVIEFLDPTGISSYDDVYRTFKDPNAPWWEKSLAVAGALPIVGKFGKAAKASLTASKAMNRFNKARNVVGTVVTPVAQMDKYVNPVSRFVATATQKGLQNAPKPVKILGDIGTMSNQGRRFWTGTDLIFGYGQQPNKKQTGGPVIGDEMEVTPEQLEMLRAQGYEFEII